MKTILHTAGPGKIFYSPKIPLMKQKHVLFNFIAGVVLIIFVTSCSKDPAPAITYPGSNQPQQGQEKIVNLVVESWVQQSSTWMYIHPILNIMQGWKQASVYVETSDGELLLLLTNTPFLTGEIWVTIHSTDIILNYRDFTGPSLPFTSLNVKIVLTN
jgi:hypothetical protein